MSDKPHQNLTIIGYVDHGKSTPVGRLLFKTGSVPEYVIERHREEVEEKGKGGFEFAYVIDSLAKERERGAIIDIAHQKFDTGEFYFIVVDCPGYRDLVKNTITGISRADNTVPVVAADDGIVPRTRGHVFLARTLGISKLIAAVNKIDVIDYSGDKYKDVKEQVSKLLKQVRFNSDDATYVPVSAFEDDNITERSDNTSWYDGDILLGTLNNLLVPQPPTDAPLHLFTQGVYAISGTGTVLVGRIETGTFNPSDNVSSQPSDVGGEVKTVEIHHEEVDQAGPGSNVGLNVRGVGRDDIRRSNVCGPADDPPKVTEAFKAQVIVMQHPSVITAGYMPIFHAHTAQVACITKSIDQKFDPASDEVTEESPDFVKSGDAIIVAVHPQRPLSIEPSSEIPKLSSSAVRDMSQTITTGKMLEVNER